MEVRKSAGRGGVDAREIRVRRTVQGDGNVDAYASVYCAYQKKSVPLAECSACPYNDGTAFRGHGERSFIYCSRAKTPTAVQPQERVSAAAEALVRGLPSAASWIEVREVMNGHAVCVTPEVSVADIEAIVLESGVSGIPVVDDEGRPLGIVSKTDLVREGYEAGDTAEIEVEAAAPTDLSAAERLRGVFGGSYHIERVGRSTAAEVMMPLAFTLPEDAPLSKAAALMVSESIHRLPVVSSEGRVVGVISTLDILRWLATHDGYVLPGRRGPA